MDGGLKEINGVGVVADGKIGGYVLDGYLLLWEGKTVRWKLELVEDGEEEKC